MKKLIIIWITTLMLTTIGKANAQTVDTSKAVIHHTASHDVSAKEIDRWHKERGWWGIGYHFVIRASGSIEKGRPISMRGAHAKGRNNYVGIALTGYDDFTPQQIRSLKKLLKEIGVTHIENHHANCPGPNLRLDRIAEELNIDYKYHY